MTLKRLLIQNLRNLNSVDINPSDRVNLIYGENGSGKTSILEAINVLALGRSFRNHKHKPLIKNDQVSFTVFGKILADDGTEIPIGINRQRDGTAIFKVNGNQVSSVADLASQLPVQVINSDTFLLLEGAPKVRRQFIDWLVFHVEPTFFQFWKDCQRCLKHRNSLLRRDRMTRPGSAESVELISWNQELAMHTEQIHLLRLKCMERFKVAFYNLLKEFVSVDGITVDYFCGWDNKKLYSLVLQESLERDQQQGYTHLGSHRADLHITINKQGAAEILSRGQQKLLVCALKIAQGYVFTQMTGRKSIYLVDDLPSELDEKHRHRLADWLEAMSTQVFITGVEEESLSSIWRNKPDVAMKLFHVEQGKIREINRLSN
ncbi:MAG: DNA replication/repair protein RecF [Pseudomonadota bacterium]